MWGLNLYSKNHFKRWSPSNSHEPKFPKTKSRDLTLQSHTIIYSISLIRIKPKNTQNPNLQKTHSSFCRPGTKLITQLPKLNPNPLTEIPWDTWPRFEIIVKVQTFLTAAVGDIIVHAQEWRRRSYKSPRNESKVQGLSFVKNVEAES